MSARRADRRRTWTLVRAAAVAATYAALLPVAAQAAPSWSPATMVDFSGQPLALSCPSAAFCAAVDAHGNTLTFNGSAWSKPANVDSTLRLVSVSCSSASFCVAVDNRGNALTFTGSSWSNPLDIDGATPFSGVACPSSSFCVAVDINGNELTFNGNSWAKPVAIDRVATPTAVSCPVTPTSFCAVVDDQGGLVTHSGAKWSDPLMPVDIDSAGGGITSVSCAAPSFCVVGDRLGRTVIYNGKSAASTTQVGSPTSYVASVSCAPATTFCVATDSLGGAATYNGSSWSKPAELDSAAQNNQFSVSCPTTTFCAAIDFHGNAYTYSGQSVGPSSTLKNTVQPALSGGAVAGMKLSATHGSWSGSPTAYTYAWEDCNSLGSACAPIAGATHKSYFVRPTDVGHTIRVVVVASASGALGQSESKHTPAVASSSAIKKLIGAAIAPPGTAITINALLGYYRVRLLAPTAGRLVVDWYYLPPGAHLPAAARAPVPELVAAGKATYSQTGVRSITITATATGRHVLQGAKRVTLTAQGSFTPLRGTPLTVTKSVTLGH